MTADLLAILDQLDEARAKATPGEWENPRPFTKLIDAPGSTDNLAIVQCDNAADAALIVAAVNAAPKVTAALRAVLELHKSGEPCSCHGRRWVVDKNWSPEDYERGRDRTEGNGLIPCGFCNFGGWDTPQNEPADPFCRCDEPSPCPTVQAITAALTPEAT